MAWLSEKHKTAFESSKVTFKSINLLSRSNIDKIKELGIKFDYCVNLAAETKLGERLFPSMNCFLIMLFKYNPGVQVTIKHRSQDETQL